MNTTEQIIEAKLLGYLDRRTPPRQIINNTAAQADEIAAILRALLRFRPSGDLNAWWERLEDSLSETCETYSWPLPKHFSKAADTASRSSQSTPSSDWTPDPVRINAKRMNAGEVVSEFWLFGECALMLEEFVDENTLDRYRSAAYFKRVHTRRDGTQDKSEADAWEQAQRRIHESAKQRAGQTTGQQPDVSRLVKTFGASKETPSGSDDENRAGFMTPDEIAAEDARRAV